jgi:hydroxyacylglutathione hydrolase
LDGQPEPPKYFAQMKRVNKAGPPLLSSLGRPERLTPARLREVLAVGSQVFDLRNRTDFERAHLRGAISTPASSASFSTYVGWFVDYSRPTYLIVPDVAQLDAILKALRAIGVDDVAGYAGPEAIGDAAEALPVVTAQHLAERLPKNGLVVLDVRNKTEYDEMHIQGAKHIPLGYLPDRLAEVPRDHDVVVHCATGYRSHVAASLLRGAGFDNVASMPDGIETWSRLLPVERNN